MKEALLLPGVRVPGKITVLVVAAMLAGPPKRAVLHAEACHTGK